LCDPVIYIHDTTSGIGPENAFQIPFMVPPHPNLPQQAWSHPQQRQSQPHAAPRHNMHTRSDPPRNPRPATTTASEFSSGSPQQTTHADRRNSQGQVKLTSTLKSTSAQLSAVEEPDGTAKVHLEINNLHQADSEAGGHPQTTCTDDAAVSTKQLLSTHNQGGHEAKQDHPQASIWRNDLGRMWLPSTNQVSSSHPRPPQDRTTQAGSRYE
jgi:hypothetical protein